MVRLNTILFPVNQTRNVTFRQAGSGDFDWLLALRKVTMDPHLKAAGFEPNHAAHVTAVETDFEWTQIILLDSVDIGMCRAVRNSKEWHLRHIQIEPRHHGEGIGQYVLERLLTDAKQACCSVVLNVLKVNPAKNLYQRLGFKVVESNDDSLKMRWES